MTEIEIKPVEFNPELLARIAPKLSLQRHLSLGIRPCLRKFQEFKTVEVNSGTPAQSRYGAKGVNNKNSATLGSSTIRVGDTVIYCDITGGFVERFLPNDEVDEAVKEYETIYNQSDKMDEDDEDRLNSISNFASIYPVVEVERGRYGPPTEEEMSLSQLIHDTILESKIINKNSLEIDLGLKTSDEKDKEIIIYPEDQDISQYLPGRKYSFVLYCYVQVFSRSGPLFDSVWLAVVTALKQTKLPYVYYDEKSSNLVSDLTTISNRNALKTGNAEAQSKLKIVCDFKKSKPLVLNKSSLISSSFGVVNFEKEFEIATRALAKQPGKKVDYNEGILISELEGEAEEISISSRITVLPTESDLAMVTIIGGDAKITKETLKQAIKIAKSRSKQLSS